ncbi:hypothetical protein EVAR_102419_1 [Eumeta japonica]|uniref:Uncharacterized protein n=1 Tax=Eumeta variegata TaxID=151549 RepID=A0A4C1Z0V7_EUMVA|nr:hypothetical protein EVAR_102419_1 [Eumeta japonica]
MVVLLTRAASKRAVKRASTRDSARCAYGRCAGVPLHLRVSLSRLAVLQIGSEFINICTKTSTRRNLNDRSPYIFRPRALTYISHFFHDARGPVRPRACNTKYKQSRVRGVLHCGAGAGARRRSDLSAALPILNFSNLRAGAGAAGGPSPERPNNANA